MKKIYIEGEACNRRLLELTKIRTYFELNECEVVTKPEKADMIFFCTCAFKEEEEIYSVERLRELEAYNKEIFVYGCLPNISPEKYSEFSKFRNLAPKDLEKIDNFFDMETKFDSIPDFNIPRDSNSLAHKVKRTIKTNDVFTHEFYNRAIKGINTRINSSMTRSGKEYQLLVSRGCQGKCSYCAIKYAVGPVKSKPVENVLTEMRAGVKEGYRKFVVLGDDPGCYGLDIGKTFPELLEELIQEANNLDREQSESKGKNSDIEFHVNEIHPKFLILYQNEIMKNLQDKRVKSVLCPVQSGDDRVLDLMGREHTIAEFKNVVRNIRDTNRNVKLYTHIIVGFPSETTEEFQDTLNAIKGLHCDYVVVFPYHEKQHTPAAGIDGKLPAEVISKRVADAFRYFKSHNVTAYHRCP